MRPRLQFPTTSKRNWHLPLWSYSPTRPAKTTSYHEPTEKKMNQPKLTAERLLRKAVVYVRQSSPNQVLHHQESQRRQYGLVDRARELGFQQVTVIDEDLGRTGSGLVERPGFQRLVAEVCSGEVSAVFCIEASRLARNGRDWHHLIELWDEEAHPVVYAALQLACMQNACTLTGRSLPSA